MTVMNLEWVGWLDTFLFTPWMIGGALTALVVGYILYMLWKDGILQKILEGL